MRVKSNGISMIAVSTSRIFAKMLKGRLGQSEYHLLWSFTADIQHQQNSSRHLEQAIDEHPPSFSILTLQPGHLRTSFLKKKAHRLTSSAD